MEGFGQLDMDWQASWLLGRELMKALMTKDSEGFTAAGAKKNLFTTLLSWIPAKKQAIDHEQKSSSRRASRLLVGDRNKGG